MRRVSILFSSSIIALALVYARPQPGRVADPSVKASLSDEDKKAIDTFLQSAKAYLDIEKNAPSQAKLKKSDDVAESEARRHALKQIIRKTRASAKQGDLFTPAAADLFRRLITNALTGPDGAAARRSLLHAEPGTAAEAKLVKVNGTFPNHKGQPLQSAPATLLQQLPMLPKGLEYRMLGNMLVLRDTEANLVVDYLPEAVKQG